MEKTLKEKLLDTADQLGWWFEDSEEDGTIRYEFAKYSPAGQDFSFVIDANDGEDMLESLANYVANYDVSEMTYPWLDHSGHGRNGAPYDMKDLYEDMQACLDMALELLNEWSKL